MATIEIEEATLGARPAREWWLGLRRPPRKACARNGGSEVDL